MNTETTLGQLTTLKLRAMAEAYQQQLSLPIHQQLDGHQMIAHLAQSELLFRKNERSAGFLRLARLRQVAYPENVICSAERNFSKQQLAELMLGNYIRNAQPILVCGPTGVGKSYLACALGHQACTQGYKTMYLNMNKFIEKITISKLDGSYLRLLAQIEKVSLLILDDFGLAPLDITVKLALLQIIEDRYEKKSFIITSQLPVNSWHDYLNDPSLADAILDRMTANAHRIELKGNSLRGKKL
jgi:DNA replication protein DnaC